MDETYGTSVDDEYVDNHDYDDDTDDDIWWWWLYLYFSIVFTKYLRRLLSGSLT